LEITNGVLNKKKREAYWKNKGGDEKAIMVVEPKGGSEEEKRQKRDGVAVDKISEWSGNDYDDADGNKDPKD